MIIFSKNRGFMKQIIAVLTTLILVLAATTAFAVDQYYVKIFDNGFRKEFIDTGSIRFQGKQGAVTRVVSYREPVSTTDLRPVYREKYGAPVATFRSMRMNCIFDFEKDTMTIDAIAFLENEYGTGTKATKGVVWGGFVNETLLVGDDVAMGTLLRIMKEIREERIANGQAFGSMW